MNAAEIVTLAMNAASSEDFEAKIKNLPSKLQQRAKLLYKQVGKMQTAIEAPKGSELVEVKGFLPEPKRQAIELWIMESGNFAPMFRASTDPGAIGQQSGTAVHKLRKWLTSHPEVVSQLRKGTAQIVKVASREPIPSEPNAQKSKGTKKAKA